MQLSGWVCEKIFKIQNNLVISQYFLSWQLFGQLVTIDTTSGYGELVLKKSEILEIIWDLRITLWNHYIKYYGKDKQLSEKDRINLRPAKLNSNQNGLIYIPNEEESGVFQIKTVVVSNEEEKKCESRGETKAMTT